MEKACVSPKKNKLLGSLEGLWKKSCKSLETGACFGDKLWHVKTAKSSCLGRCCCPGFPRTLAQSVGTSACNREILHLHPPSKWMSSVFTGRDDFFWKCFENLPSNKMTGMSLVLWRGPKVAGPPACSFCSSAVLQPSSLLVCFLILSFSIQRLCHQRQTFQTLTALQFFVCFLQWCCLHEWHPLTAWVKLVTKFAETRKEKAWNSI